MIFHLWGVTFPPLVWLLVVQKQSDFSGWFLLLVFAAAGGVEVVPRCRTPPSTSGASPLWLWRHPTQTAFLAESLKDSRPHWQQEHGGSLCIIKVRDAPLNHLIFQTWCDSRRGHVDDRSPGRRRRLCLRAWHSWLPGGGRRTFRGGRSILNVTQVQSAPDAQWVIPAQTLQIRPSWRLFVVWGDRAFLCCFSFSLSCFVLLSTVFCEWRAM